MAKKLGFGFMRLPLLNPKDPTSVDLKQVCQMVDAFLEKGFTYFDTAYMYHEYKSEEILKEALIKRHKRDCFTVATKLPTMFLKTKEDKERIFQEQLEKCGVDYFDYYLLHNLNRKHYETAKSLDCFPFIVKLKEEGKARNIGFSFHDTADVLDEILTEHPEVDFVQLQINYLDWDNPSIQSGKCYETAKKHGKKIIVMEPVKGGALAQVPKSAEELFKKHNSELSAPSWAIRFAASLDQVIMVLSGMSDMEQLLDNTGYMENFKPFTQEEFQAVDQAVRFIHEATAVPCTSCQYCVEGCPKKIAIPKYFELYNAKKKMEGSDFSTLKASYENYIQTFGKASECIGCKKCENSCPQHLTIIKYLKDVADIFEV